MTDTVHVPFGDNMSETATLLLAAAEETKNEAHVVVVDHFTNSYVVPAEVAKKAGLDSTDPDADFAKEVKAAEGTSIEVDTSSEDPDARKEPEAPAKKTAAKKTTTKKAAAKKSTAKKTAAKKS
jgi:hypothetical protein